MYVADLVSDVESNTANQVQKIDLDVQKHVEKKEQMKIALCLGTVVMSIQ